MASEKIPCVDGSGIRGEVRVWSEDPLTARVRSIWSGADFLPIARRFEPGAAEFIAPIVSRVHIVSGQAAITGQNADISAGGHADLVVMDDFISGEPHAINVIE